MVVIVDTSNHPGSQRLPRLEDFVMAILGQFLPKPQVAGRFDPAKLDDIKKGFKPKLFPDGGGCMLAAYDVIGILYGPKFSQDLIKQVNDRAKDAADKAMKTQAFKQKVEQAKAANPNLSDAEARQQVWKAWHSAHNTSDHTFALMGEKGVAGDKVHTLNKDADQAIQNMTPSQPGAYFYGLAVRDTHTVMLAVEVGADGKRTMYWLDQGAPGLRTKIDDGKLGEALQNRVFHGTNSTNIYALRPPGGGKP